MMEIQSFTFVFVLLTVVVSIWAFRDRSIYNKLLLYPKAMDQVSEYHRFISHGFIHADEQHLIFNMIALFSIGSYVELFFKGFGIHYLYPVLYLSAIFVAALPSYIKHRNNPYFASLGASGGTSAVMFSLVYLAPWEKFSILFIIPMWAILFAVLYVWYSVYMSRRQSDNVNHDAHLWGALYGFAFTFLCDPTHGQIFTQQILNPRF